MVCATPERAHFEADLEHRVLEKLPVLALGDGFGVGPDEFDAVFGENALVVEVHRGVERRLAAEGGEDGVWFFGGDDLFDDLHCDRLDVRARRELRVGHDRGRVGVEQDDGVTLLRQRLARLHAGIVELAALSDDDGAAADEEDFFEVGILGHGGKGKKSYTLNANRPQTPRLKRENLRAQIRAAKKLRVREANREVRPINSLFPSRKTLYFDLAICLRCNTIQTQFLMPSIRISTRRLALALVLGCAILVLAPLPRASAQFTPVVLTSGLLDKLEKFTKSTKDDPAVKAEMDVMDKDKDEAMSKALMEGTGLAAIVSAKYPKIAAALKDAGMTADEYGKAVMSLSIAAMTAEMNGPADANTPQANIDFAKANKERITALMSK